ncbi:sulfate adenylyltransferase subunit 1 [Terriglobus roseus DSM 18391]|uniref:Sulfate adenylyltransferase subunit 1 n=1 Tax=Terriglobus roseus (strain DSM 18391 / NRRL B-41598 / KBS 63) TaxID=926566 RepID=I3ZEJ7_TERRK|nr:sulfate adenylyltransferase subunit CysN [Terriglobus roseus]AFL87665.1 sulfate adenylyltransferase subunit 1 [Terriglobus roseus DSM 18391]
MSTSNNDLVELHLETSQAAQAPKSENIRAKREPEKAVGFSPLDSNPAQEGASAPDLAANGAPSGEPEAWNSNVALHNPHLGQTPEPEPIHVSAEFAANFNIGDYLAEERGKDLLRFSTAGSVDDGKSTLIGRLLYDTQSVYDDQIQSIEGKGTTAPGVLDLALLTDGLRAEREQGITIDVAYRYFSTARRKFIIADTPGHEQYTRNMATGASTADVAVVLVDARKGVLIQSRRHAYITALLGVRNVIVAVNKMDLVDYSEEVFEKIQQDFTTFFHDLDIDGNDQTTLHFVPVSALAGDNVVHSSMNTWWYEGPTLLGLLESIPSSQVNIDAPFRMAVQRVIRPNLDFRGFAGQIAAGIVRVGDTITALPSGKHSKVQRIVTFDGDLPEAFAPLSVTLTLEDEIDISRGDLLVNAAEQPVIAKGFTASLVWMDETPLELGKRYLLKQGSRSVPAQVSTLVRTIDLSEVPGQLSHHKSAATLSMNGIGNVTVEALQPLAFDTYAANRHTGSFVLIDLQTNATVAAGMIRKAEATTAQATAQITRDITLHPGHALRLQGSEDAITAAIEALRNAGALREND